MTPGIIALHLNGEEMRRLFRQFAIQRAISDIGLREDIQFISVLDSQLDVHRSYGPHLHWEKGDGCLSEELASKSPTLSPVFMNLQRGWRSLK